MDTRSRLLACTLRLFAARGYDAVGVQEIVEAAGVTKPTLYHHFGSKRGLLEALLAQGMGELLAVVEPAAAYAHDVPLTLNRVTAAYFGFADTHRAFYRLQLGLWFAPPQSEAFQAVQPWDLRQQQLLEELFARAAEDHGNMRGRHKAYAVTFLGMINTYIGLALNDHVRLGDELVYRAVHQFMHGIFS